MTSLELLQQENAALKARVALLEMQLASPSGLEHVALRGDEAERHENEAWLRLGFEVAEVGTWRREIATDRLFVDARAQRHFDFDSDQTFISEFFARLSPDDRENVQRRIAASLDPSNAGRASSEVRLIYRDGGEHWLLIDSLVLFEGEGEHRHAVMAVGTTRDITQRKQVDAALRSSEERYRGLVESLDSIIVLVDPQGNLQYINGQTEKYIPIPSNLLTGKNIFEVLPQAEAQQSMLQLQEVIAQNAPAVREWRLYINKQILWFRISLQPIRDEFGQVKAVIVAATDITHLKSTEEALRGRINYERMLAELSTRFISLPVEQAGDAITEALGQIAPFFGVDHAAVFRVDLNAGEAICLHEWATVTTPKMSLSDQRINLVEVPQLIASLQHNEVLHLPDIALTQLPQGYGNSRLARGPVKSLTMVPMVAREGLFGCITFSSVLQRRALAEDELASLKLFAEVLVNAFERWRTEDEIRQNNLLLEQRVHERTAEISDLYNNAPCGYHSLDANGRYILVNDTELSWLGYRREDLIGKRLGEVLAPDSASRFIDDFALLKAQGFVKDVEVDMVRRDGSLLPVLVNATVVRDADGNMVATRSTILDMTERRLAEQALRKSEIRLNYLLAETPALIFTLGGSQIEDLRVTYCSPSSKKLLGFDPQDLMQEWAFYEQIVAAGEIYKFVEAVKTLVDQHEAVIELPFFDASGAKHYFSVGMRMTTFEPGKLIEIIGYAVDISSQIATEHALRGSEARWRSTVQNAPALIGVVDKHGIVSSLNRPILDQPIESLIGRPLPELFPKPNRDHVQQALAEMFASGISSRHTFIYDDLAGEQHYLRCYFGPIQNSNESDDAAVVIVLDITDLKRTEIELQEQRDFARQVTDSIEQGILVSDTKGCIVYINPFLERMLGQPLQNVMGVSLDKFVVSADVKTLVAQRENRLKGETSQYEITMPDVNGNPRIMLVTAAPRWRNGEVSGAIALMTDMTETKEVEARLRESRDALSAANFALERAARMKDEFLASMSHELRTPLTAILGLSEGLTEQVLGPLNAKQVEAISTIESSGRHLLNLINEILDLSKIEAGVMDLIITSVPVTHICNASLLFVREMATKKRIKTFLTVDSSVEFVMADERRLKQMLVNLLSNAVKFTPIEGRIGLEVNGDVEAGVAHFTVWDTGIGIDNKDIDRLFQPFVQLNSSLSRHYTGTGLGLSLVARMAELHGGSVTVESEVNRGSRFTISLPWTDEAAESTAQKEAKRDPNTIYFPFQNTKQVLLVEDAVSDADILTRYLNEINAKATVLPRGEGVVDYAAATSTDVILLDLMLPDQTGWSVLQQLKANTVTASIPVVVVSVLDESSQALSLGASAYLVKPVTRQQLQGVLAKVVKDDVAKSPRIMVISEKSAADENIAQATASVSSSISNAPAAAAPLILLAEDNEANIQTVCGYLEAKGYSVLVAHHGGEAIDLAQKYHPKLILMDVQMPVMDGIEATRQLRRDSDAAVANIPIVALTALAMPGDRQRLLNAGANDYLPKPVSLKNLTATIERMLS